MKKLFQFLGGCILVVLLMNACSGDKDKSVSAPTLSLTPKMLLGFAGNEWNKVKPALSNKKGYKYTEFSGDQGGGIKAVVSQPATIAGYEDQHYWLTLNIAHSSNMVAIVSLGNDDSVATLSQDKAYLLFDQFYENVFSKITDTSLVYCGYQLGGGMEKRISLKEAIDKIDRRDPVDILHISITGYQGAFMMSLYKEANGNFYFGYDSYKGYF